MHFLAEDSYPSFDLPVPNTKDVLFRDIQKPQFFLGAVTEKQYCMVKKEGTRYRVPIGTKFCRIKVRPLSPNRAIISQVENRDIQNTSTAEQDRKPLPFYRTNIKLLFR